MHPNPNKTKLRTPIRLERSVNDNDLSRTDCFKYVSSVLSANSKLRLDIASCINTIWMDDGGGSLSVIFNWRVNDWPKSKFYSNVFSSAAAYASEEPLKTIEIVMKAKILLRIGSTACYDHVRYSRPICRHTYHQREKCFDDDNNSLGEISLNNSIENDAKATMDWNYCTIIWKFLDSTQINVMTEKTDPDEGIPLPNLFHLKNELMN